MYSDDLDYAVKRLNSTLVRLNTGEAYYVNRTYINPEGRMKHSGTVIDNMSTREVFHEELDLTPVPLGYVNITKKMVFVMRKPMRNDWRQGLHHNSMATCGAYPAQDVQMTWLLQPIQNKYPSFARALSDLNKRESIAFSREFGLVKNPDRPILRFRNYNVGTVIDGRPVLAPNKLFLEQHLQEAVGM